MTIESDSFGLERGHGQLLRLEEESRIGRQVDLLADAHVFEQPVTEAISHGHDSRRSRIQRLAHGPSGRRRLQRAGADRVENDRDADLLRNGYLPEVARSV